MIDLTKTLDGMLSKEFDFPPLVVRFHLQSKDHISTELLPFMTQSTCFDYYGKRRYIIYVYFERPSVCAETGFLSTRKMSKIHQITWTSVYWNDLAAWVNIARENHKLRIRAKMCFASMAISIMVDQKGVSHYYQRPPRAPFRKLEK